MKTTVSEKGQITIPKALRDRLGLHTGTVLDFQDRDGQLVAYKVVGDAIDSVYGSIKSESSTDEIIEELRGSATPK